jgi:hypothetical protein
MESLDKFSFNCGPSEASVNEDLAHKVKPEHLLFVFFMHFFLRNAKLKFLLKRSPVFNRLKPQAL